MKLANYIKAQRSLQIIIVWTTRMNKRLSQGSTDQPV
jgi:hypothetical protein